jgi:hypothetical protein
MRGCDREAGRGRVDTGPMRVSGVRSPAELGPLFRPATRPVYGDVTVKARFARDFKRTDSPFRGRIRLPMLVQPFLTSAGAPERGTGAGETLRGGPL